MNKLHLGVSVLVGLLNTFACGIIGYSIFGPAGIPLGFVGGLIAAIMIYVIAHFFFSEDEE